MLSHYIPKTKHNLGGGGEGCFLVENVVHPEMQSPGGALAVFIKHNNSCVKICSPM